MGIKIVNMEKNKRIKQIDRIIRNIKDGLYASEIKIESGLIREIGYVSNLKLLKRDLLKAKTPLERIYLKKNIKEHNKKIKEYKETIKKLEKEKKYLVNRKGMRYKVSKLTILKRELGEDAIASYRVSETIAPFRMGVKVGEKIKKGFEKVFRRVKKRKRIKI